MTLDYERCSSCVQNNFIPAFYSTTKSVNLSKSILATQAYLQILLVRLKKIQAVVT